MLLTASQQSLSPESFGDDLKMFGKTGSTSSGYCSSPQDEASDESFDGDKGDYFGNSYKLWGDNTANSEHIAHNILSQLFEDERKSPLPSSAMSMDSGVVWSNDYSTNAFSDNLSSPLSSFSDENTDSAFMQWNKMNSTQASGMLGAMNQNTANNWPSYPSINTPVNPLLSHTGYNPAPGSGFNSNNAGFNSNNAGFNSNNAGFNSNNTGFNSNNAGFNSNNAGFTSNNTVYTNSTPHFHTQQQQHHNAAAFGNTPTPINTARFNNTAGMGGFSSAGLNANNYIVQQARTACPTDLLQQNIMRRKLAEQQQTLLGDPTRCFTPPNRLYPSNIISLSHHKKLPPTMAFNNMDYSIPQHPQHSPDSKILVNTIDACCSQLLQLNREQKKYEYEIGRLSADFVRPTPPPKQKSLFKLDLLVQSPDSSHGIVVQFVEIMEKVSKGNMKIKNNVLKHVKSLEEICREIMELKMQITVTRCQNHEQIHKLIATLNTYLQHTKAVRSNLSTMVVLLRNNLAAQQ